MKILRFLYFRSLRFESGHSLVARSREESPDTVEQSSV